MGTNSSPAQWWSMWIVGAWSPTWTSSDRGTTSGCEHNQIYCSCEGLVNMVTHLIYVVAQTTSQTAVAVPLDHWQMRMTACLPMSNVVAHSQRGSREWCPPSGRSHSAWPPPCSAGDEYPRWVLCTNEYNKNREGCLIWNTLSRSGWSCYNTWVMTQNGQMKTNTYWELSLQRWAVPTWVEGPYTWCNCNRCRQSWCGQFHLPDPGTMFAWFWCKAHTCPMNGSMHKYILTQIWTYITHWEWQLWLGRGCFLNLNTRQFHCLHGGIIITGVVKLIGWGFWGSALTGPAPETIQSIRQTSDWVIDCDRQCFHHLNNCLTLHCMGDPASGSKFQWKHWLQRHRHSRTRGGRTVRLSWTPSS